LPERRAEEQPAGEVTRASPRSRLVLVKAEQAGDEPRGPAAERQHVHVLSHAVEREHGEEAGADGEIEPGHERRGTAGEAPHEGHRGGHEDQVQQEGREDHQEGQVPHPRDETDERAQVALQRSLVVGALGEDRRGPDALHEVEGDEGGVGAVAVHPPARMEEGGEPVQDGGRERDERFGGRPPGTDWRAPRPRGHTPEAGRERNHRRQPRGLGREPGGDQQDDAAQQGDLEQKVAAHAPT
jgi:hypothetical protein